MSQDGRWSGVNEPTNPSKDVVGIHAALLHTNKVLLYTYDDSEQGSPALRGDSSVFDLKNGNRTKVVLPDNLFCSGQSFLPDGQLVVAGGFNLQNLKALYTFTPSAQTGDWKKYGTLPKNRWYPTLTTLPDGRIFIISGLTEAAGLVVNNSYEIFDFARGLEPPVVPSEPILGSGPGVEGEGIGSYPFVFVLPNNKLFIHLSDRTAFIDISNLSTGKVDGPLLHNVRRVPRTYVISGSCVLLPLLPSDNYRARIMIIGGGGLDQQNMPGPEVDATDTCEILDTGRQPLAWQSITMPRKRVLTDSVLLPDGTVLVLNGTSKGGGGYKSKRKHAVFEVDLFDPSSLTWTTLSSMTVPRLYHSTALLLPDGRVMTAGTDKTQATEPGESPYPQEYRIEIFEPPYMNRGPRAIIESVQSPVYYGTTFEIKVKSEMSVGEPALLRQGAVTHSFNTGQRYIGLTIKGGTRDSMILEAPPNGSVAPPGYYLLFLRDLRGVPSEGKFILVTADPLAQKRKECNDLKESIDTLAAEIQQLESQIIMETDEVNRKFLEQEKKRAQEHRRKLRMRYQDLGCQRL